MTTPRKPGNKTRRNARRTTPAKVLPELRLLKVAVQPTFVLVDGDNMAEVKAEPMEVQGGNWDAFARSLNSPANRRKLLAQMRAQEPVEEAPTA